MSNVNTILTGRLAPQPARRGPHLRHPQPPHEPLAHRLARPAAAPLATRRKEAEQARQDQRPQLQCQRQQPEVNPPFDHGLIKPFAVD